MSYTLLCWLQQEVWALQQAIPIVPVIVSATVSYLSLVHLLRFQRVRALRMKYGDALCGKDFKGVSDNLHSAAIGRSDVALTPEKAQEIVQTITQLEMPGLMRFALTKAIFNTYAIVSTSILT